MLSSRIIATDHRLFQNAMTVEEMIDELSHMDPEAVVVFESDYGDICHTRQALMVESVSELPEDQILCRNDGYSRSGVEIMSLDEEDEEEGEEDEGVKSDKLRPVVVLNLSQE